MVLIKSFDCLPMYDGKDTQAGPGPLNSAAMGPRLLVGVHGLCVIPPMI